MSAPSTLPWRYNVAFPPKSNQNAPKGKAKGMPQVSSPRGAKSGALPKGMPKPVAKNAGRGR